MGKENDIVSNLQYSIGEIVTDNSNLIHYRIIYINCPCIYLCEMNITKLNIFMRNIVDITSFISQGIYSLSSDNKHEVYNIEQLSESQEVSFRMRRLFIQEIEKIYGPTYLDLMGHSSKEKLKQLQFSYQLTRPTLWKYIRIFLQSGLNEYALIDNRSFLEKKGYGTYSFKEKSGRPDKSGLKYGIPLTQEIYENFSEALTYYKSGRCKTYAQAFDVMNSRHFMTYLKVNSSVQPKLLPISERPTFNQFYYYAKNNLSPFDRDGIKTSKQEQRNNQRLLLSDAMFNVQGPGDRIQMDEVEVDLSLVSVISGNQAIGRPIVYVMIDVYTRVILAIGISFDNNSMLGMTHCFLNLGDNKVDFCQKYGFTITPDMWPSCCFPKRILCDRGSEYVSAEAKHLFNELGITRELVSGGTGSLKGCVEQWFHQMNMNQKPFLENHGLIEKRHDSHHHKESILNIDDFTKLLINFVLYHNNNPLKDYPLTPDMIKEKILPTPSLLWKYGCQLFGSPRPITNLEQYYFSLMLPQKGKICRKGLYVNNLVYLNPEDQDFLDKMYAAGTKHIDFPVRIDPRDVGSVYYLKNNQLMSAPLNDQRFGNAEFAGLTLSEWKKIHDYLNTLKKDGIISSQEHRAYLVVTNQLIIDNARKNNFSSTCNMREMREREKQIISNENSIKSRLEKMISDKSTILEDKQNLKPTIFNLGDNPTCDTTFTHKLTDIELLDAQSSSYIPKSFDEAIQLFNEGEFEY